MTQTVKDANTYGPGRGPGALALSPPSTCLPPSSPERRLTYFILKIAQNTGAVHLFQKGSVATAETRWPCADQRGGVTRPIS